MSELPTALLQTLTRTTNALRAAEVPFALAGGLGVYARGGPFSEHDVDVLIRAEDAETALKALEGWGMTRSDPNEDWLVKAYDDGLLVDLLFRPNERPVRRELLDEAEEIRVGPVSAPVMPASFLLVDKLLVLGPHRCDLAGLLPVARALREQVDWPRVRRETAGSPYAEAFLLLVERLGVAPESGTVRGEPGGPR